MKYLIVNCLIYLNVKNNKVYNKSLENINYTNNSKETNL